MASYYYGGAQPQSHHGDFQWDAVKNMGAIDARQRQHLQNVYAVLAMSTFSAAAGAYMYAYFYLGHFISVIGAVGTILMVNSTPNTPENQSKRLMFTLAHAALLGNSIGPLLEAVAYVDPSIVTTALAGTFLVFACFSAAAIVAPQRYYIFLGGFLGSMLSIMALFSLVSVFFYVEAIFLGQLYLGLALFCGYVVYDTQVILEKARMGVLDPIADSIQLFTDFFAIFVRLLIILARNRGQKREERDRRRR